MLPTHLTLSSSSGETSEPLNTECRISIFSKGIRYLRERWRSQWNSPDGAWSPWLLGAFLVVAVILVYSNTLHGPFQYDDSNDIRNNVTIRHLWPLWNVIHIPNKGFMSRPLANLTFALNYATGGLRPFHFHLTNLCIHVFASLAFLGVLRRTLSLPALKERYFRQMPTLSLVIAALWALHPLLTESVSYITQRYESLMGLFVFLTFYCVLRMADSPSPMKWSALASLSCLFALGSKEVAVSVPILVLLFDRTFMAGSFRGAWRQRRGLYLGLILAWTCFAYIQFHLVGARTFAGYGLTMPWWRYALNQPNVILHYLRLAVWPHPLNFDYFWPVAKNWTQLLPGLLSIGSLLGLTLWALIRNPSTAFLSVFFFCILAPTSSVMPILDLAVEHRMYLPLAPVIICVVCLVYNIIESMKFDGNSHISLIRITAIIFIASTLSVFGTLTYLRNEDYQNPQDLWRDVVIKSPRNPRAHHNYAFSLEEAGYIDAALREYDITLTLAPNVPIFLCNYGTLLGRLGRHEEALKRLRLAVQLEPDNYKNIVNLGVVLWQKGSLDSAITCFVAANRLAPDAAIPYYGLSAVMLEKNEPNKAHELILKAMYLEPDNSTFRFLLGSILLKTGDLPAARNAFQAAMRLDADPAKMASEIGWAFHNNGMNQEALSNLRYALSLEPDHIRSQVRLAWILSTSSDDNQRSGAEALTLAKNVLKSQPTPSPELLDLLAVSLAESGQFSEAQAAIALALAQSKDRKEKWVPDLEKRLALFEKHQAYREPLPNRIPSKSSSLIPGGV